MRLLFPDVMNNETFMREYLTNLIFKILDKTVKVLFNRVQMNESKRPDTKGEFKSYEVARIKILQRNKGC
ncbi:hypothetical protein D1120_06450 [Bacillus velezensis]|nr:hypothetical protein D1120_06450 [Bacillus velezensis]